MRIGLVLPEFKWPGGTAAIGVTIAQIARDAEAAGFASLWVMDHFFQIGAFGAPEDPMLEGYSVLNYLAGVTRTATLGTLVTGVSYHHPGILLKTVTTLDVLSGGRAYLGIGAAWNEDEHRGLGVPFPPLKDRFTMLEETLQIAHQMWTDDDRPYHGQQFHLTRPLNHPQPVSRPHPPILVGGGGERKTLRLVAQYADACNLFLRAPDEVRHKLDVLRQHCADLGRPYTAIEKTCHNALRLAPDGHGGALSGAQLVDHIGDIARLGFDHAIFSVRNVAEPGVLDQVAAVQAQIAAIPPGGRAA